MTIEKLDYETVNYSLVEELEMHKDKINEIIDWINSQETGNCCEFTRNQTLDEIDNYLDKGLVVVGETGERLIDEIREKIAEMRGKE